MAAINVTPRGPHEYGVRVTEGSGTTTHHVTVPEDLLDGWGLGADDEAAVVRASFEFLLEREPATSILERFSLSVIERYFPEYRAELPNRL